MKKRIISIVLAIMLIMNMAAIIPMMSASAVASNTTPLNLKASFSKTTVVPGDQVVMTISVENLSALPATQEVSAFGMLVKLNTDLFVKPYNEVIGVSTTIKGATVEQKFTGGTSIPSSWDDTENAFSLAYAMAAGSYMPKTTTVLYTITLTVKSAADLTTGGTYIPTFKDAYFSDLNLDDYSMTTPTNPTLTVVIPGNKTALNAAIDTATTKVATDYSTASFATLATALADAKKVAANAFAEQAAIDSAKTALETAITGLVAKTMTGIEVSAAMGLFMIGDDFSTEARVVTVTYDNGTTKEIPLTADMVTGFDSSVANEMLTLTVTYTEGQTTKTTTYDVSVMTAQEIADTTKMIVDIIVAQIGEVDLTDEEAILSLRENFNSLPPEVQALLGDVDTQIKALETKLAALKAPVVTPAPTTPTNTTTKAPGTKTGDYSTSVYLLLSIMMISGLALVVIKRKRSVK